MFQNKKRVLLTLIMVITMIASAMVVFNTAVEEAEAKKSAKDSEGYYYMDSLDPSPKTTYNWVQVAGTGGATNLNIYGSSGYGSIDLSGWSFPHYGMDYSRIYVAARGYLALGSWGGTEYGYSSGVPQRDGTEPMIAVMWGYGYSNAQYITGVTDNLNWVAIEWATNSYGGHYQVILYESGVIKMQYDQTGSSSYTGGYYHSIGIEDETGNIGISYKGFYDQTMVDDMAIIWSFAEAEVSDLEVENSHREIPDGEGGNYSVCYAQMKEYKFTFNVTSDHPTLGVNDINEIRVYFGPPSWGIYARYTVAGGFAAWSLGGGGSGAGNGTIEINTSRSDLESNRLSDPWNMVLYVEFTFEFPWEGMVPMTVWAKGAVALPTQMTYEDVFYLDTGVKMVGEFMYLGNGGRMLQSESFTRDNETVTFTGVTLMYNMTSPEHNVTYYPPNSSFYISVIDDELNEYSDMNVSGRDFSISINMPLRALRKEFNIVVRGIPVDKIKGNLPTIAFKVDDSTPVAPASLVIRADSFKDNQKLVDNDDTLYFSWSSVTDSGSGVDFYKISHSPDPNNETAIMVDSRITQYIWTNTTPGDYKIYVWAVDKVGHVGDMASQFIKIDKDDPFFVDFSHEDFGWIRTETPTLTITAKDGFTISEDISGVRRSTAEYSVSTTGEEGFEDWISVGLFDEEEDRDPNEDLDISVSPRLVEGTENYIKYRIKDWAGNGYTVSAPYRLEIDVTEVSFENFFPTQDVWHNYDVVNTKEVSLYLRDDTSGVYTDDIFYRISHGIDEAGEYIWETGIQQQGGWEELDRGNYDRIDDKNNLIWIHFPYEDFQEGEMNFIQFIAKDMAGNGKFTGHPRGPWTRSPMYQILVNTQPVAVISSPEGYVPNTDIGTYDITDLLTFDASESYDVDVDAGNLKFEWKEGNRTLGTDMILENFRFEKLGFHTITLYVGDSGHKGDERSVAELIINITQFVPSYENDMDGDGMVDGWEYDNLLDMYDDSDRNEDPDGDGYTNYQEYLGDDNVPPYQGQRDATNPWDPVDKLSPTPVSAGDQVIPAPFAIWVFIAVIIAAIVIALIIILIGYLRIHREEDNTKREESEEEAMLATPQLDIPTMPEGMPMVDTSVPTLPAPEAGADQQSTLPPAMEGQPMDAQPMDAQPMDQQPQPYQDPMYQEQPQQTEDPLYQEQAQQTQNPMYEGQQ